MQSLYKENKKPFQFSYLSFIHDHDIVDHYKLEENHTNNDNLDLEEEFNILEIANDINFIKIINNNLPKNENVNLNNCKYISNNFSIISKCCDKEYCCRICHDLTEDHELNSFFTKIKCKQCNNQQNYDFYGKNKCKSCSLNLTCKYSCLKCHIITNKKNYTHCDKCGKCYNHKSNNIIHENNICFLKEENKLNKSFKINLQEECSICFSKFSNKLDIIKKLSCGHFLHNGCYEELIKTSYKCPVCCKTILNMANEFEELQKEIEKTELSELYREYINIYCNDCNSKSNTYFHYKGNLCKNCGSFNTKKV